MKELAWKEAYKIGHFQIDDEHKKLIALANKAIKLSNDKQSKENIHGILKALNDYVIIHFRNEENYMQRINYPGLEHQKQCHSEIIGRMNKVVTESANLEDLGNNLKRLMLVWMIEHIIHEDKKIASP